MTDEEIEKKYAELEEEAAAQSKAEDAFQHATDNLEKLWKVVVELETSTIPCVREFAVIKQDGVLDLKKRMNDNLERVWKAMEDRNERLDAFEKEITDGSPA